MGRPHSSDLNLKSLLTILHSVFFIPLGVLINGFYISVLVITYLVVTLPFLSYLLTKDKL